MPKPALPFLHRHRTRHGKSVYYVKLTKREKGRGVRILAPIVRSEQFMMEYHAAVRGAPIAPTPAASKDGKGTLGWLIKQYRKFARLVRASVGRNAKATWPDPATPRRNGG